MRPDVRVQFSFFVICGMLGCQGQAPTPNANPPLKASPATNVPAPPAANTEESPRPPETPDAPPVKAVKMLLADVEAGRWEAIAEFLPNDYVQDLEALLKSAVAKTPDEIWTRLQSIAGKITLLSQKQPQLFAGTAGGDSQQLQFVLNSLGEEATWDRSQWKTISLASVLSAASSRWRDSQPQPPGSRSILSQTDVSLESLQDDQATLRLKSPMDQQPQTVEFVQFDGKWIPKPLADAWPATVRQAADWLDSVSEEPVAAFAQRLDLVLLQVDATLEQMLKAERIEEAQLGWWQIQSLLIQAQQELWQSGPPPRVELVLAEEPSDDQLTELLKKLTEATDNPEQAEYLTFPTASGTVIQLSPVSDLPEFVKRLDFLTIKSSAAEGRRVEIELKREK